MRVMADFYDEVNVLVNGIASGKIDREGAQKAITELKDRYGEDAFPSYIFEEQSRPWTKEYLDYLRKKNITGACSEEFILHMAEVNDYLKAKKKKILFIMIVLSMIILVGIIFLIFI